MSLIRLLGAILVLSLTVPAQAQVNIKSSCLKPLAIPDTWTEMQTPPWDPGDTFDRIDRLGNSIPNPDVYTRFSDGYRQPAHQGLFLNLSFGSPYGSLIGASMWPLDLPIDGQPSTGGQRFWENLRGCNATPWGAGDVLEFEPGSLIGPLRQALEEVITSDPGALWDPTAHDGWGGVVNSAFGDRSPRVLALPAYDPNAHIEGLSTGIFVFPVIRVVGFFVAGVTFNGVQGYLTGWSSISLPNVVATHGRATLAATVVGPGSPLSGVPVQFGIDGAVVGTAFTDETGTARLEDIEVSDRAAGEYPIEARLPQESDFFIAVPASAQLTIHRAETTTTITSTPNPSTYGSEVILTTSVTAVGDGSPVPDGGVTFIDNGMPLVTALVSGGRAVLKTATISGGEHLLTADYEGTADFLSSASPSWIHVVEPAATVISLTVGTSTSTFGEVLTLSASITSSAGIPTGTVQFLDSTNVIGTAVLSGGTARIATSHLLGGQSLSDGPISRRRELRGWRLRCGHAFRKPRRERLNVGLRAQSFRRSVTCDIHCERGIDESCAVSPIGTRSNLRRQEAAATGVVGWWRCDADDERSGDWQVHG